MGLLDFLSPKNSAKPSPFGQEDNQGLLSSLLGIQNPLADHRGLLMGLSAGMFGNNPQLAALGAMQGMQQDQTSQATHKQNAAIKSYISSLPANEQAMALADPAGFMKMKVESYGKQSEPYTLSEGQGRYGPNGSITQQPKYENLTPGSSLVQVGGGLQGQPPRMPSAGPQGTMPTQQPPSQSGVTTLVPGISPEELSRQKQAGENQANKASAVQSLSTADAIIDRAYNAYKALGDRGRGWKGYIGHSGLGPISANPVNRFIAGTVGAPAEQLRQEYESANAELQLMQAQLKLKGQGQVSDAERRLLTFTLPRLDAADNGEVGLRTLDGLRQQLAQTRKMAGVEAPQQALPQGVTIRQVR